jgi:hypothetical protein
MKARDKAFQETGDYDVYADTPTSSPTYSPPDPSTYTYEGSDEQDRDNEDTASTAGDAPGYSGPSPFEYGGRVGYSNGGLSKYEIFKLGELGYNTKGGTVLEPFGGIKVLRDILKVNKYADGGIVGLYI